MDNEDLAVFFMLTTATLFTTSIVFATLWLRARERAIRASLGERPRKEMPRETPMVEMEHLMQAVDSIAIEVERISEAQRFTTQVLMERVDNSPSSKRVPERVITPH